MDFIKASKTFITCWFDFNFDTLHFINLYLHIYYTNTIIRLESYDSCFS